MTTTYRGSLPWDWEKPASAKNRTRQWLPCSGSDLISALNLLEIIMQTMLIFFWCSFVIKYFCFLQVRWCKNHTKHYNRNHQILSNNREAFLESTSAKILCKDTKLCPNTSFYFFQPGKSLLLAYWIIQSSQKSVKMFIQKSSKKSPKIIVKNYY